MMPILNIFKKKQVKIPILPEKLEKVKKHFIKVPEFKEYPYNPSHQIALHGTIVYVEYICGPFETGWIHPCWQHLNKKCEWFVDIFVKDSELQTGRLFVCLDTEFEIVA